jgi:small GTP-binding protein
MSDNLEIIVQLEKQIGKKLPLEKFKAHWGDVGYHLGNNNKIIGLSLYECNLKQLPEEITQLRYLQKLYLRGNQLTQLPKEIVQLQKLQDLNLGYNQLTQLPKEIAQLHLQNLDLSNNQLTQLPKEIAQLQNLQDLDLSSNRLTQLPKEIAQLQNLHRLDLRNNQLTQLSKEITQLQNLQTLILWHNQLMQLPKEIAQLQNLQRLYLSDNQLTQLPKEIAQLHHLHDLDLTYNQLTKLPKEITQLNLEIGWQKAYPWERIFLAGNPLQSPPPEIVKQGKSAIIDYFNALNQEKSPLLNECKLLIVGQGAVGKTSLVNRLRYDRYNDAENKTEGINIAPWQLLINEQTIRVNIWDFGGQEIMHATHQFFLTKRSLYLLVLDARQGENESRIEYWLKLIQSLGGNSPILVIINKIDAHGLDLNRRWLQEKYPTIQGFHEISCKTKYGILPLQDKISHCIEQLPNVHEPFPATWFAVKEQLETLRSDYIPYSEYQVICQEQAVVEESSQRTLITFLHDLGIVLNFHEDKRLKDTNVLNPEWVTEGVYQIINAPLLRANNGVLALDDLNQILNSQRYQETKHLFIIDMMKKFELCFEFPDSQPPRYLVPELLPKEQPELNWDTANSLAFQFHYDVLPTSIMTRFIVKMHQNIHQHTYWHTGVVLRYENNQALLKSDTEDKKIFIWIAGQEATRRHFLSIIRHTFHTLHEHLPKINAREKVPYKTEILDYKDLLTCEENGRKTLYLPKLNEDINVKQVLDGIDDQRQHDEGEHQKPQPVIIQSTEEDQLVTQTTNFWTKWGALAAIVAAIIGFIGIIISLL